MTDPRDTSVFRGQADDTFDAGDAAGNALIDLLRRRLQALQPGQVLHLVASDPALRADVAAWCRMTRHHLIASTPPDYWIRKRED